jgi:SAM-dependent methyltransferase
MHVSTTVETAQILDACCGGRMWWWDKAHPLALYMDKREAAAGTYSHRPNWKCEPDVIGDFRDMPFDDGAFQLVVFDPPHIARPNPSGDTAMQYGALDPATEQFDLRNGFQECWRVLAPGGTLVFKWAGALDRVYPHFPAEPIVGTRSARNGKGLGTRWFIFYKPLPCV